MAGGLLLALACSNPVFVTATPRVVGTSSADKPNNGYLRVEVTSNFDAFDYAEVAKGFKYLSVGVTVSNAGPLPSGQAPSEYPLLLLDLENRAMMTVSGVGAARGEYVNFESNIQPVLTFSIRAIPKTVAGAYADAFQTLQRLSAGIPLSQLADSNPYLSLAGRLLSNIANEANSSHTQAFTTAVIGLSSSAANTSPFPLDGTPTVIFLRRTDDTSPFPEPQTLQLCTNNPSTLCASAGQTPYGALPYLIIRASTTDFRPTSDWVDNINSWSCEVAKRVGQIEHVERALHATRFTEEQERAELKMLEHVRLLSKAYMLPDKFDLQQPDNLETFASILNTWRLMDSRKDAYWSAHYEAAATSIETCLQSEMKRRSQQHETAFVVLSRAFSSASAFRAVPRFGMPPTNEERNKLEEWLAQIKEPILFLNLQSGEVYGSLRAEQDAIERYLIESAHILVAELTATTDTKTQNAVREKINARLLSPCDSCRAILVDAIEKTNLVEIDTKMLALQQTERARRKLVDTRQRAEQIAQLAKNLQTANAGEIEQLLKRVEVAKTRVNARKTSKTELDSLNKELDDMASQLRNQLLETQ
ncbi:MAG: hypothetical protein FWB81_02260 [Cystobacterineae bacterium]|nr:hypothetical protein [Cystobacterineae bacterium]